MDQLNRLSLPVLVGRLINSHHHLLALRICKMLGLPTDQVQTYSEK